MAYSELYRLENISMSTGSGNIVFTDQTHQSLETIVVKLLMQLTEIESYHIATRIDPGYDDCYT